MAYGIQCRQVFPKLNKSTFTILYYKQSNTTYLGIEISNDLRWTPDIDKITKRLITRWASPSVTYNQ